MYTLLFGDDHESLVIQEINSNNFIWIDVLDKRLSNGKNGSSLSFSYQNLFKKYSPAFFFEMGNSPVVVVVIPTVYRKESATIQNVKL